MKKAIIATLLSGAISAPAFAANGNDLADANLIFNMDNSQSMELAVLSSEEMKSTEGAWVYHTARFGWGAVSGGVGYTVSNYGTNSWSWGGLGRSVGYGGVGGLLGWNSASAATIGAGTSAALSRWGW